MGTRSNIVTNLAARDDFRQGVIALKTEPTGIETDDLAEILHPIGTASQPLSTWDLFVLWHAMAMNQLQGGGRNAAHSGPAFLPWHRWFLLLLEFQFQRVLGKPDFALAYWDWASDGEFPQQDQPNQTLWSDAWIGGSGNAAGNVNDGPFTTANGFFVVIRGDNAGRIWATRRALQRTIGAGISTLPDKDDVATAMTQGNYDASPWDADRDTTGFRNWLEGWARLDTSGSRNAPNLHNRVHVWIGGDMGPATSPNDPVFFLNHCNVDRLWAAWQAQNPGAPYVPAGTSATNDPLYRHRRNDPAFSVLTDFEPLNNQFLDVSQYYDYDSLVP